MIAPEKRLPLAALFLICLMSVLAITTSQTPPFAGPQLPVGLAETDKP